MKRRLMLKQVMMAAAVAALAPSCTTDRRKTSLELKRLQIDGDQEALLAEVVDTLIPSGDIPGAKTLNVHRFVLKMVDDCYDEQTQAQLSKGLTQLDEYSEKQSGKSFMDESREGREQLLQKIQSKETSCPPELLAIYPVIKQLTIQGFLTTEAILKDVQGYEQAPGRFHGCVEIAPEKKSA